MTQVISVVAPPKAMTPAPSPMKVDDQRGPAAADSPGSPTPRPSKKRAASINTSEANSRLEQLRINTPSTMDVDGPRDLICLCTPAPKIPRPRNAFILYRQHHQAQVVNQNQTLSNPEISKIIGEQWKEESDEVKGNWKRLAEEEKHRHQQQYPDYRYQPRRGTRAQGNKPGSSSVEEPGRCPKCNGRSIATPRTPSTPYATPTAAKPGMHPYPPVSRAEEADIAAQDSYGGLPASRPQYVIQRPVYRELDDYGGELPELKRRRYNMGGHSIISSPGIIHEAYGARSPVPLMRGGPLGAPQAGIRYHGPPQLPEPGALSRPKPGNMPPPPRPSVSGSWPHPARPARHPAFDESLRLPPLQTTVPMSPSVGSEVDIRHVNTPLTANSATTLRDNQDKSIEAMVMSIPFPKKLAVLSTISKPLKAPGPGSPDIETRGAIIAVEGPKPRLLPKVGQIIEKALTASGDVALKTWDNHSMAVLEQERTSHDSQPYLMPYFQTMMEWHTKSGEMVKHITSRAEGASADGNEDEHPRRGSAGSLDDRGTPETKGSDKQDKMPVALLKEGFSLTLSDAFACTTPIIDSYAPADHWQWMATLWRGVIGADLTVYVKPSRDEEIARFGTVEFQQRLGFIVVRIPVGQDVDEATGRRIAFEVTEWLREAAFRDGFSRK